MSQLTKREVFEEHGWHFQTFKSGYASGENSKPLLPTGCQQNSEESEVQSNNKSDEKLLPVGVKNED